MTTSRSVRFAVILSLWAAAAGAQSTSTQPAQPAASASSDSALRPSTATASGDTGLWYVPTAEVLARGKWSASGYRVGLNYIEGFTNVADFPVTFAYGVSNRAEVFGSFKVVTRIDRDLRPLFSSNTDVGGVNGRYPFVKQGWSGNQVGNFIPRFGFEPRRQRPSGQLGPPFQIDIVPVVLGPRRQGQDNIGEGSRLGFEKVGHDQEIEPLESVVGKLAVGIQHHRVGTDHQTAVDLFLLHAHHHLVGSEWL